MLHNVNSNLVSGSFENNFRGTVPANKQKESEPKDKVDVGISSNDMPANPRKELTVLFYMNGQYEDITTHTANALISIEKAGSDENTHVVAQLGRYPSKPKDDGSVYVPIDGDWEGIRRYEVRQHNHSELETPIEEWEKLEPEMPDNPVLKYVIGNHHWSTGNKELANKYFDEARACGMNKYIDEPDSDFSKKVRTEFNEKSRHLDEAKIGKKNFASKLLEELPKDAKMKDPAVLKDFISWGMQKYPANYYKVVVMAHGGAWMGASGMSPDDMAMGIEQGTAQASYITGEDKQIDLLTFNSCYMGNLEALSELRDTAKVTLASENYATTGVFRDWDNLLGNIQGQLKEGKSFDPVQFASDTVEKYRADNIETKENFPDFYTWKRAYPTLTAIDNKKIGALVDTWKNFNNACKEHKVTDQQLFSSIEKAKDYASGAMVPRQVFGFYDQIRDLGDIMDHVRESDQIPEPVKEAAGQVKKALSDCIINEQSEGIGMEGSQGLTIWGPTNGIDVLFMANSYNSDVGGFNYETGWGGRLKEALDNVPQKVTQEFLKNHNTIKTLREKISRDDIDEKEKEKLQKKLEDFQDRNVELKKEMDFTRPMGENIFKNHKDGIQLERLEGKFEEEKDRARQGNMKSTDIR